MRLTRNGIGHPVLLTAGTEKSVRAHTWHAKRGRLPLWVVCDTTTADYPGRYVARLWVTLPHAKPTKRVLTHDTLDGLRSMLPAGLLMMPRSPQDPSVVIESWV